MPYFAVRSKVQTGANVVTAVLYVFGMVNSWTVRSDEECFEWQWAYGALNAFLFVMTCGMEAVAGNLPPAQYRLLMVVPWNSGFLLFHVLSLVAHVQMAAVGEGGQLSPVASHAAGCVWHVAMLIMFAAAPRWRAQGWPDGGRAYFAVRSKAQTATHAFAGAYVAYDAVARWSAPAGAPCFALQWGAAAYYIFTVAVMFCLEVTAGRLTPAQYKIVVSVPWNVSLLIFHAVALTVLVAIMQITDNPSYFYDGHGLGNGMYHSAACVWFACLVALIITHPQWWERDDPARLVSPKQLTTHCVPIVPSGPTTVGMDAGMDRDSSEPRHTACDDAACGDAVFAFGAGDEEEVQCTRPAPTQVSQTARASSGSGSDADESARIGVTTTSVMALDAAVQPEEPERMG